MKYTTWQTESYQQKWNDATVCSLTLVMFMTWWKRDNNFNQQALLYSYSNIVMNASDAQLNNFGILFFLLQHRIFNGELFELHLSHCAFVVSRNSHTINSLCESKFIEQFAIQRCNTRYLWWWQINLIINAYYRMKLNDFHHN